MRNRIEFLLRIALILFIWLMWWCAFTASLSKVINLSIILGGILLIFPFVWLGRKILDRHQTTDYVVWTTTFVHCAVGILFGVALIRAVTTYQDWQL
jgi:hypothetical protein